MQLTIIEKLNTFQTLIRLAIKSFSYINDLLDNLTHKFKVYTNDGKLIVEIGTDRDDDDMQFDLNKIVTLNPGIKTQGKIKFFLMYI